MKNRLIQKIMLALVILLIKPVLSPAQEVLFKDTFNGGMADGWEFFDAGTNSAPSNWFVSGGRFVQHTNIGTVNFPKADGTIAVNGSAQWSDYDVHVLALTNDNDFFGIIFRFTDENNFYRFGIDADKHMGCYIHSVKEGKIKEVARASFTYLPGKPVKLRLSVSGEKITAFIDGTEVIKTADPDHSHGKAGLFTWFQENMIFDNFTITENY